MSHGRNYPKHERKKPKKAIKVPAPAGTHVLGEASRLPIGTPPAQTKT